jgi:hypothetical protein
MAETLGIGMSHAPMFQFPDEHMADMLKNELKRERLPAHLKEIDNWPLGMQEEWGDDEGLSAAHRHRETMVTAFRQLRAEVDAFNPDFILIWGDDQYENFKEDVVPPFCVYIYDQLECLPYRKGALNTSVNVWGQPEDKTVMVQGHEEAGNYLARSLLEHEFDVAYSYKPHHHPTLAHSFMRTLMFLDYDQRGLPYPVIPFHVNCYGSDLMRARLATGREGRLAPPAPSPRRCFDLGQEVARIIEDSPWRAVVIGSSSWSHASLTAKHHWLYPDTETDQRRLEQLQSGKHTEWRNLALDSLTDAGEHELLNWICLAGAMGERKAEVLAWNPTYIFNSDKCAALFRP